ncbi:MAG TPA: alpha/beta fold hydrolase, partial [Steroidobacteraceae bacterium]
MRPKHVGNGLPSIIHRHVVDQLNSLDGKPMAGAAQMTAVSYHCADGGELRYSSAGTGEPVVLIHGLGLDAAMWDAQWPAVQREFRAIRYDVRGFGDSSIPVGPYSNSDDLLGLL